MLILNFKICVISLRTDLNLTLDNPDHSLYGSCGLSEAKTEAEESSEPLVPMETVEKDAAAEQFPSILNIYFLFLYVSSTNTRRRVRAGTTEFTSSSFFRPYFYTSLFMQKKPTRETIGPLG